MVFSVSIGDVIALCEVTMKIGEAIGAGRNAPKDYKKLKREVDRFEQLIDDMEPLRDRESSPATERLLKLLLREMEECKGALTAFVRKNPCPESILAKVLWVFRGPKRCESLRDDLSIYRQSLAMRLNSFYAEEQRALQLLHNTGLTRTLNLKFETIYIVDPVGEYIPFPTFLCSTYELLVKVIQAYYQHQEDNVPGRGYVVRGDFKLVYGNDKQLVQTNQWKDILNPRLKVEMSMILRRNGVATDTCPRCRTSFHGDASGGWATCQICYAQFRINQQIEEIEEPVIESGILEERITPSVASLAQETMSRSNPRVHLSEPTESQQPEWTLFRLLSIESTVFRLKPRDPWASYLNPRRPVPPPACPTHAPFSYAAVSPQDDSIDNRLAPIQRAFANQSQFDSDGIGGLNKFKIKKILAVNDAEVAALCERVKNRDGLVVMIHYIVESAWYKEGKQEQLPDHSLQKLLPKRRGFEAKGSPFGAFFSSSAPFICYLCEKLTSQPSVSRALGHARQHFGHTIDGHYANTRRDQERRAIAPRYHCLHCDKPITVQNKVRHEASARHREKVWASMATPTTVLQ